MCFSPTASFTTAGVTGLIGVLALTRVKAPRELLLAATPLFFALQQAVEGLLWLNLPMTPDSPASRALVLTFLIFAQVFWPVFAPAAVLAIETSDVRRRLMLPWLVVGAAVAAYLFWGLVSRPHGAVISQDHIVYRTEAPHSTVIALAYLAATTLPALLSSRRTVVALGAIVLVGSVVAHIFYLEAFQSVWCYFAGAGSVVILCHFAWVRRFQPRTDPA